jgi:iron uptake system EfeUOB component EfeO/EfeM
MRRLALLGCAACLLAAGCGGSAPKPQPPAQPLAGTIERSGTLPPVRPADLERPIAGYRRHVRAELGRMLPELDRLQAAERAGDRAAARRAWLAADARYESIGAAYGAFGDLDAAINGRPAGLAGGVRSPDFTGLHRVERILWTRGALRDSLAPTRRLARDVRRLRARVRGLDIDPLEYSLRAHEVLEDSLHLQLSGQASPWSGGALVALRANVRGTRVVLGSVRGLLMRRDPVVVTRAERQLRALSAALADVESGGQLPRWDGLARRDRERIAGRTAAAAEALAFVPELLDPRPLRPSKPSLGRGA